MKRIDTSSNTASKPAYAAGPNAGGYFTEGTPGVEDGTIPGQDWFNHVQEELVNAITDDGASLDGADDTQLATRISPLKAIKSDATTTGSVTTTHKRAIVASTLSTASGENGAAIASSVCTASGSQSLVGGSGSTTASGLRAAGIAASASASTGDQSAVLASVSVTSNGNQSAIIASNGGSTTGGAATEAAVIACSDADATGTQCAVIASAGTNAASIANAAKSVVMASDDSTASGVESAVIASDQGTASGQQSACLATDTSEAAGTRSVVIAAGGSKTSGNNTALFGLNCEMTGSNYVGFGHSASTITFTGSDQNLKLRINNTTGDVDAATGGTFNTGALDYAEMFANAEPGEIPVGSLVVRRGERGNMCAPATEGDRVLGVVSATPGVLGGAAKLEWAHRYLRDEWDRVVTERVEMVRWGAITEKQPRRLVREAYRGPAKDAPHDAPEDAKTWREGAGTGKRKVKMVSWPALIERKPPVVVREGYEGRLDACPGTPPDDAELYIVDAPVESPDYRPVPGYQDRTERPGEWTAVAMMGQLRVRVDHTVVRDSFVIPSSVPGVGTRHDEPGKGRPIECMEITSPYDPARGYAVALCLVG